MKKLFNRKNKRFCRYCRLCSPADSFPLRRWEICYVCYYFVRPRQFYEEYLKSRQWRARCDQAKARAGGSRCEKCDVSSFGNIGHILDGVLGGQTNGMNVHHLTYARFGMERVEDLQVVCRKCHVEIHKTFKFTPDLFPQPPSLPRGLTFEEAREKALQLRSKREALAAP